MSSFGTTCNQQVSAALDGLSHISAPRPPTPSSYGLALLLPAPDPPEPEVMTDMPSARTNRPPRDELTITETPVSIASDGAITSCIGQTGDGDAQLQHMVFVTLLFIFFVLVFFTCLQTYTLHCNLLIQAPSNTLDLSDDRQRFIHGSRLISEGQVLNGQFNAERKEVDSVDSASIPPSQPDAPAADIPDAQPLVNQHMTSVPSPRHNQPPRNGVNADQAGSAPGALGMPRFTLLKAATSASTMASQATPLDDRSPPLGGVFLPVYCLS